MSDGELLDAREAMSVLGINEAELQTMVARGDLRAFRSAGTMKFRRDDVVGIKGEKKTEPTIIMPAPAGRPKPGSGILPTVSSTKSPKSSSRNLPTIKPSARPAPTPPPMPVRDNETSADHIILEDLDLAPSEVDPAANTQQVTAQNAAITGNATIVDDGPETGNMTVVETVDEAGATASAIAPVATSGSASGRQRAPSSRLDATTLSGSAATAPAVSRVQAAVRATTSASATRRSQTASATARRAHPISTAILVLTSGISLLTASILTVQLVKGNYDPETHQRVIPPFLGEGSALPVYTWTYDKLPGNPDDTEGEFRRPATEFPKYTPH